MQNATNVFYCEWKVVKSFCLSDNNTGDDANPSPEEKPRVKFDVSDLLCTTFCVSKKTASCNRFNLVCITNMWKIRVNTFVFFPSIFLEFCVVSVLLIQLCCR